MLGVSIPSAYLVVPNNLQFVHNAKRISNSIAIQIDVSVKTVSNSNQTIVSVKVIILSLNNIVTSVSQIAKHATKTIHALNVKLLKRDLIQIELPVSIVIFKDVYNALQQGIVPNVNII